MGDSIECVKGVAVWNVIESGSSPKAKAAFGSRLSGRSTDDDVSGVTFRASWYCLGGC